MKIAVLIQCHCLPEQINRMTNLWSCEEISFFIHVDKKSLIKNQIVVRDNVFFVPEEKRVDVRWSQISQVDATLSLISAAMCQGVYDYYWLCSGQDFPIKSKEEIIKFFEQNPKREFINLFDSKMITGKYTNYDKRNDIIYPLFLLNKTQLTRIIRRLYVELTGGYNRTRKMFQRKDVLNMPFFFGSQWWCLSKDMIYWMNDYLDSHPEYREFFSKCICADESFFQTLVMNSPYRDNRREYLHYIDWTNCKNSPRNLNISDFEKIVSSEYLIARKCNMNEDKGLIDKLEQRLKREG